MTDQTKRKPPEPLPPKPQVDIVRQQKNLRELRELMGMNRRAVT